MAHVHRGHYHGCPGTHTACRCEISMYGRVVTYALLFFGISFVAGRLSNSLSLETDGIHFVADAAGYLIAMGVGFLKTKHRAHPLVISIAWALVGLLLLAFIVEAVASACLRLLEPRLASGPVVIIVALIGFWISKLQHDELSRDFGHHEATLQHGNRLHAFGDMLFGLVIAAGGVITLLTHIPWVDSVLSLFAAAWILSEVARYFARGPLYRPEHSHIH